METTICQIGRYTKTPIGLLAIDNVKQIQIDDIKDDDVQKAGYTSRSDLEKELLSISSRSRSTRSAGVKSQQSQQQLYKIEFRHVGADPRIELRKNDHLTPNNIKEIDMKLNRFDNSKKYPKWSRNVLICIQDNPGKSSTWISQTLDIDKVWLKPNIRKLKELGLTISLEVGYKLSPRGKSYVENSSSAAVK